MKKMMELLLNKTENVMDKTKSIEISGEILSCLSIKNVEVERKINSHSSMKITGTLDELGKTTLKGKVGKEIRIKSYELGTFNSILLFAGLIERIEFISGAISTEFVIEAKSFSIVMDRKKRKRSFQDIKKTYGDIFEIIKDEGKYETINFVPSEKISTEIIDKLVVQYEESDWELLNRLCSVLKAPIVLEDGRGSTEESESGSSSEKKWLIWLGLPDRGAEEFQHEKSVTEVTGAIHEDYLVIKTPEKYEIGDRLNYCGTPYVITEADTYYTGNIIETEYRLEKEENIWIKPIMNEKLAGKSILAEVVEVGTGENLTRVRVDFLFENKTSEEQTSQLESDETDNTRTSWEKYWFKFSTPYSSGDNGIYFMPELKDRLLVNFPDNEEDYGYVGESLRDENQFKDSQSEIEHKRIKISTGQQVVLSKSLEKVRIIGNEDRTVFADVVKDHINFNADGSEAVLQKDLITLKNCENTVQMNPDGIMLQTGGSTVKMTDDGINLSIGDATISMKNGGIEIKCGGSKITLGNGKVNIKG